MLQKVLFHWHLIIVLCNCPISMLKLFSFKNAIFVESYCVHRLGVILRRDSYTCWSDINELILNMIQTTKFSWQKIQRCEWEHFLSQILVHCLKPLENIKARAAFFKTLFKWFYSRTLLSVILISWIQRCYEWLC